MNYNLGYQLVNYHATVLSCNIVYCGLTVQSLICFKCFVGCLEFYAQLYAFCQFFNVIHIFVYNSAVSIC